MADIENIGSVERWIQTLGFPVCVCIYFMFKDWRQGSKHTSILEKIAQTLSVLNRKEIGTGEE